MSDEVRMAVVGWCAELAVHMHAVVLNTANGIDIDIEEQRSAASVNNPCLTMSAFEVWICKWWPLPSFAVAPPQHYT